MPGQHEKDQLKPGTPKRYDIDYTMPFHHSNAQSTNQATVDFANFFKKEHDLRQYYCLK